MIYHHNIDQADCDWTVGQNLNVKTARLFTACRALDVDITVDVDEVNEQIVSHDRFGGAVISSDSLFYRTAFGCRVVGNNRHGFDNGADLTDLLITIPAHKID